MLGTRSYSHHGNSRIKKSTVISNLLQNRSNKADPNDVWVNMEEVEEEISEEIDFFGKLVCLPCSESGVSEPCSESGVSELPDIKFHKIRGTFRRGYGTSRASQTRKLEYHLRSARRIT